MSKFITILSSLIFLAFTGFSQSKEKSLTNQLKGQKFYLINQVFISHDIDETRIDTVQAQTSDYILFSDKNIAYMNYKGRTDSLKFKFINNDSLSMGDTPFLITNLKNGYYQLYQKETENNGDYNSVTYLLKKEAFNKLNYAD